MDLIPSWSKILAQVCHTIKRFAFASVPWEMSINRTTNEPRHDKTNKMTVRPPKTQISLGIRPVWSESSLCAQWVAKDPRFLLADIEESDQTGRMPRLIWVFAGRTLCWFCHVAAQMYIIAAKSDKYVGIIHINFSLRMLLNSVVFCVSWRHLWMKIGENPVPDTRLIREMALCERHAAPRFSDKFSNISTWNPKWEISFQSLRSFPTLPRNIHVHVIKIAVIC